MDREKLELTFEIDSPQDPAFQPKPPVFFIENVSHVFKIIRKSKIVNLNSHFLHSSWSIRQFWARIMPLGQK